MTHQIVQSLRTRYQKVVTAGASSGGEIANVEAARYRDVDGVADLGWSDLPLFSAQLLVDNLGPELIGLVQPYVSLEGSTDARDRIFFNAADADPAVIAESDALVQPIASSELHTATLQAGRALDPLVNAPVLVAFGQQDGAWLPACQNAQAGLYVSSPRDHLRASRRRPRIDAAPQRRRIRVGARQLARGALSCSWPPLASG